MVDQVRASLSTDVYRRTASRILLCLPKNFPRHRGSVALAEEDELKDVGRWITLSPAKVSMWDLATGISHIKKEGRNCVWN